MKIEIELVAASLKKYEVEPATMRKIIEDLQIEAQPDPGEEKAPPVKKQYAILVSDKDGLLKGVDMVGWVIQLPDSDSVATVLDRIHYTAYDYNTTKKGQIMPVASVGEALENIPSKMFKEADLWVKTKTPVLVVTTNNLIPKE